ncbi:MAG: hypothetical protein M1821_002605 [Bathelium mastoideum]|nr:MAG: hypothetical protein M1821_002605 [Bathelium mastoideum]
MTRVKLLAAVAAVFILVLTYLSLQEHEVVPRIAKIPTSVSQPYAWTYDPVRDERNLGLTEEQCEAAFPGQDAEIVRAREWHAANGGIDQDQVKLWIDEPDKAHGQVRILVYDGDIYVVGEKQGVVDRTRYLAGLSMIYRSIVAIPDPRVLPNVEFTLDRMDHPNPEPHRPGRTAWGWCRHKTDNDTWVMPDFNGWSSSGWDAVGGYRAFREKSKPFLTPFKDKLKRALWRGQLDVGQKISTIRKKLLEVTEGKPWSDCGELQWGSRSGVVPMEEHWPDQVRFDILATADFGSLTSAHGVNQFEQNYVAAQNDWSDLENIMDYYLEHQDEAERIAEESKRFFRDRYLTPAAEACYIRRMIYEYAKVQNFEPQLYRNDTNEDGTVTTRVRGVSWERFAFRAPKKFDVPPFPEGYWFKSNQIDFED